MGLNFNLSDGTTMTITPDLQAKMLRLLQQDVSGKTTGIEIPFNDLQEITKKVVDLVKLFI